MINENNFSDFYGQKSIDKNVKTLNFFFDIYVLSILIKDFLSPARLHILNAIFFIIHKPHC